MMQTVSDVLQSFAGKEVSVNMEKRLAIPRNTHKGHMFMQGGGTDGVYGYFAMNSGGDSRYSVTNIYKVDLDNWRIIQISDDLYMNHANDIAYDSKKNRLIVSHCDINPDHVSIVDPGSLRVIEEKIIPQCHFSIAYSPDKEMYVAGKSRTYDLVLLDESFQPVKLLAGVEGYIKQGLACDDRFIYFFQTGSDANWIFVFDWDGSLIHKISIPMVGESENLFVRGDKMICAFNNHTQDLAEIYEVTFSPQEPME